MKIRNRGGFTLIELMVCVAIFAIVLLAVQQVFNMVIKLWLTGDARLQMYQHGRYALEVMGVDMRSAVRPGDIDFNRDGLIDSNDSGTSGIRFIGVNHASQGASATVSGLGDGIGYGYKESDAVAFHSIGYSTRNEDSDMNVWLFGCSNKLGSTNGVPVIYAAKKISNRTLENANDWERRTISPTVSNMMPRYYIAGSGSNRDPTFYSTQDFQLEYFRGTLVSGTGQMYWDSAVTGDVPTMVKICIQIRDERGVVDPLWIGTYASLKSGTGL